MRHPTTQATTTSVKDIQDESNAIGSTRCRRPSSCFDYPLKSRRPKSRCYLLRQHQLVCSAPLFPAYDQDRGATTKTLTL